MQYMAMYLEKYFLNNNVKFMPKYDVIRDRISYFFTFLMPYSRKVIDTYLYKLESQSVSERENDSDSFFDLKLV